MVDRSWDREGLDQHVLGRHVAGLLDEFGLKVG